MTEYTPQIPEAKKYYHEYNNSDEKPFEGYSTKSSPMIRSLMKSMSRQKESPISKFPSSVCLLKVFQAYEIYLHNNILKLIPSE